MVTEDSPFMPRLVLIRFAAARRPGSHVMSLFRRGALMIGLLSLAAWAGPAAAEDVVLKTDQTSLMMLNAEPGTIVVGNPGIADVTLNGKQLFLHGKAPGTTNLMILDGNGERMADLQLIVANDYRNQVSLYSASAKGAPTRSTFSCAPDCEPTVVAGDSADYLSNTISSNGLRASFATGANKKTNETQVQKPTQ